MSENFRLNKRDFSKTTTIGIKSNTNIIPGLYEIKEVNRRPTTVAENSSKPPKDPRTKTTLNFLTKLKQDIEKNKLNFGITGKDPQVKQNIGNFINLKEKTDFGQRPVTFAPGLTMTGLTSNPRRLSVPRKTDEDHFKESLSGYTVQKVLGRGAYAVVRLALHNDSGKKVAIKTYERYQIIEPIKKNNLLREIEILKKLDHPNIVKLKETIEGKKHFHLVLEYVKGSSLYNFIKSKPNGALEEVEARRIFKQVLSALDYCHEQSVAHRDIKLDNVLLDKKFNVKIIDFGFSTLNDEKSRVFCGTPSYMAPEIVGRKDYHGLNADIWALGILLYAMVCGKMPFKAYNDKELFRRIEKGSFSFPNNCNETLRNLLNKMLDINPRRRPSIKALLEDDWVNSRSIFRSTTQNIPIRSVESNSIDLDIISGIVTKT
jgi:serine/threonine protein kinase